MKKIWDDKAWEDYLYWQLHDKQMLKRLNALIRDVEGDPFRGIGKPEPLRGDLSGVFGVAGSMMSTGWCIELETVCWR